MTAESTFYDGGCPCRFVRYRMSSAPMFVHCCHCQWCQRESGAAFAVNALIEADRVNLLNGEVHHIKTPSLSGEGQSFARCPDCHVAVWSHYAYGSISEAVCFVRVGTLDEPHRIRPDIHIYTSTKQPWVVLPADVPAVPAYYDADEMWPQESLDRRAPLIKGRELI